MIVQKAPPPPTFKQGKIIQNANSKRFYRRTNFATVAGRLSVPPCAHPVVVSKGREPQNVRGREMPGGQESPRAPLLEALATLGSDPGVWVRRWVQVGAREGRFPGGCTGGLSGGAWQTRGVGSFSLLSLPPSFCHYPEIAGPALGHDFAATCPSSLPPLLCSPFLPDLPLFPTDVPSFRRPSLLTPE